jgi:hypothetical protein
MSGPPVDLSALEPEQRSSALAAPLPKKQLSTATVVLLWFLRVYVALSVGVVIIAFARALR